MGDWEGEEGVRGGMEGGGDAYAACRWCWLVTRVLSLISWVRTVLVLVHEVSLELLRPTGG